MSLAGRRAAVSLFAVVAGLACVWSAADRSLAAVAVASPPPGLATSVNAQRNAGYLALSRNDPSTALLRGQRAVSLDPVDTRSVALLGSARFLANRLADADAAFFVSGQLGWRDMPTQLYWLARALDVQDYRAATLRAEALVRTGGVEAAYLPMLGTIEQSAAGRAALAARLASSPRWAPAYIDQMGRLPLASRRLRLAVLRQALTDGLRPPLASAAAMIASALYVEDTPTIVLTRAALYPGSTDPRTGLSNPGFAQPLLAGSPALDWQIPDGSSVEARVDRTPDGASALVVRSGDGTAQPAASQIMLLPPGRYHLAWDSSPQQAPEVEVTCANPPQVLGRSSAGGRSAGIDLVIQNGCRAQTVQIYAAAGDPSQPAGWITGFTLRPLR